MNRPRTGPLSTNRGTIHVALANGLNPASADRVTHFADLQAPAQQQDMNLPADGVRVAALVPKLVWAVGLAAIVPPCASGQ
jgi:hypothetical protein